MSYYVFSSPILTKQYTTTPALNVSIPLPTKCTDFLPSCSAVLQTEIKSERHVGNNSDMAPDRGKGYT